MTAATLRTPSNAGLPLRFPAAPPLSLYVHLPWCVRKCPYCDFNSYEARSAIPDELYVDALLRDLDSELHLTRQRPLTSVFIGGGTPSLFSGPAVARLIDGIAARCRLETGAEITLEANPGSVEAGRFSEFRRAGVNRLSIGVQSFRNRQLAALGRVHDSRDAARAVETAAAAGFDNINVDLMYGLPGDDPAGALRDLETAIGLGPAHLSWYQLTLEPNTAFERRPPALPADGVIADIEARGRALLADCGYGRYEISGYARPGRRCAHNLHYWRFGDYLGIGAGAHGKVTLPPEGAILRRARVRNPRTYMERAGGTAAFTEERVTDPGQVAIEFLMNALRLTEGVDIECFEQRTGQPFSTIAGPVTEGVRRGWLHEPSGGGLRTTARGLEVLNSVLLLF